MNAQEEIQQLAAAIRAEPDSGKRMVLTRRATQLIQDVKKAEMAANVAAKLRPAPLYPVGLEAKLGDHTAKVVASTFEGGTWRYHVDIPSIPIFGSFDGTEAEIKAKLAEYSGQPAGPAYPKGVAVYRNGRGGLVEDVKAEGGTYSYQIKGWPNRVTEAQLVAELAKA